MRIAVMASCVVKVSWRWFEKTKNVFSESEVSDELC